MCGIAGLICPPGRLTGAALADLADAMGGALLHRGPDAGASWRDEEAGVALSYRRLAIQDLSEAGDQPMISPCGRYVMVYNGEVYNAPDMRAALEAEGHRFRGHSDTEVLLAAIAAWGLEQALDRSVGMFALGLWDRSSREISLVRDRVGIKPLYWTLSAGRLVFASELKALLIGIETRPGIDRAGLASYLHHGYILAPHTIYAGVGKLAPGVILRFRLGAEPSTTVYWSLAETLGSITPDERIDDPAEGRALIEETLGLAVRQRLLSDVPLGVFLSGGVDSSLITALMQESSPTPINSYSIGSPSAEYDEARYAREIAAHLGTRHTELNVDEAECLRVVPDLMAVYDEPFGDSSQVPALVLSRLARQHVTVALSGDGGDEVFAGYNRYLWHHRLTGLRRHLPTPVLRAGARVVAALPSAAMEWIGRVVTGKGGVGRDAHKLAAMLRVGSTRDAHRAVIAQWSGLGPQSAERISPAYGIAEGLTGLSEVERMQVLDLMTYLPDDILTKVDRASMAHSLEVRVPFLDHRVIRAAFRLAPEIKLNGRTTKSVLRRMLYDRVPRSLVDRPKMGFSIPIDSWLRGGLKDWAGDLVAGTDWSGDLGIADEAVRLVWSQHLSGVADRNQALWSILMLADWWRRERAA